MVWYGVTLSCLHHPEKVAQTDATTKYLMVRLLILFIIMELTSILRSPWCLTSSPKYKLNCLLFSYAYISWTEMVAL